jgi:hypothetical protein
MAGKTLASACEVRFWRLSEVPALGLHQAEERPEDPATNPMIVTTVV